MAAPYWSFLFKCLISLSNLLLSLFSNFLCSVSPSSSYWSINAHEIPTPKNYALKQGSNGISVSEMNMVVRNLGMQFETDADEMIVKEGELEGVFEEEEPSLEEIREAFEVFDENRDGFIDAEELSRVLSGLGFITQSEDDNEAVSKCEKMIGNFDRNGDGLLDFPDFLKLMELSLNSS
uniref:EF-hand domain-containing protein n=1 Tax=Opuntia streptacantha TaxID=393608 RepID=A0A7C9F9B3_OPUST